MKLFKQLHISRIVLLARVPTALPFLKELINLFCLLRIFTYLDVDAMFIFLISLYAKQFMITVRKALGLSMGE